MTNISTLRMLLIVLFAFSSTRAVAQRSDVGNWFIYFGNQAINKKWNWWNEVQYRNYNFAGDLQQLLLRTGIGYNLSENNNNLLLGYGFIRSERYLSNGAKTGSNEHRVYQQFITRQHFGRVLLQHRYRIEERFLPDDFQVRFRYFLACNIPLNNKTMSRNTVYLSAYNELFLNAESPVFDRNRLYGAIGYVINKYLRAEAGFMAQTLEASNRNQFQLVFFNNLPLKKSR
ncbi:MAG TPA: DUF2490 domain-containing protein [Ferruginibacter sp.]|nr:DUF2490 domain-containing protein [Ferruginibacter sp.]HNJ29418.1 DUF2490 domain-containing protein [Ferruginibacter sp.]